MVFSYPSVASFESSYWDWNTFYLNNKSTKNWVDKSEFFSMVTRNRSLSATSFMVNRMGSNLGMVNIEVKTPRYPLIKTTIERSQRPVNSLKEVRSLVCDPELPFSPGHICEIKYRYSINQDFTLVCDDSENIFQLIKDSFTNRMINWGIIINLVSVFN